jgi:hypothetical protein
MSTTTRTLAGVGAGLTALALTFTGPAAFAALPVPDPTGTYSGPVDRGHRAESWSVTPPVEHHTAATVSGISTWMLLLIITTAIVLALLMVEGVRRTRSRRPAIA